MSDDSTDLFGYPVTVPDTKVPADATNLDFVYQRDSALRYKLSEYIKNTRCSSGRLVSTPETNLQAYMIYKRKKDWLATAPSLADMWTWRLHGETISYPDITRVNLCDEIELTPSEILPTLDIVLIARGDNEYTPREFFIKEPPSLRVGDQVEYKFNVEDYTEVANSVVVKKVDAEAWLLQDGFVVVNLSVKTITSKLDVGTVTNIYRADVVNGGRKTVFSAT